MDEFESKMSVMKIRDKYSAPYKRHMYLYLLREDVKTKANFLEKLKSKVKNWKDGQYYLKLSSGKVFARFKVEEGKVRKLYRSSPITQKEYICWRFFKK
ncbi:MAG: hypothetical protein JSW73_00350 [Candidatus Woesearchaeota archaeon]|nr:MAG: hypothetical protein JSW73_00350 [Candidatus Woesearchaeota archaeon]